MMMRAYQLSLWNVFLYEILADSPNDLLQAYRFPTIFHFFNGKRKPNEVRVIEAEFLSFVAL